MVFTTGGYDMNQAELAQRLRQARMRKFKTAALAVEALNKQGGVKRRTYYSHEAGERTPSEADLRLYSELFGVTPEYLRYGTGAEQLESEPADGSGDGDGSINQAGEQLEIISSHNPKVRFIVVLSAGEIGQLATNRGDLANMSGRRLPVPDFLDASAQSFIYIMPDDDLSMATLDSQSIPPGTIICIDLDQTVAPILPGRFVLARLKGYDEPLIRRYVADRPYNATSPFTLEALNPSYKPIDVSAPSDCELIGRIILTSNRR